MVGSLRAAADQARREQSLYFAALLPQELITAAFAAAMASWSGRIFSPVVTVWVFLSQCLSPDHSCRDAVGRLLSWLLAQGRTACSPDTGAYCLAREKIPEAVSHQLLRQTGQQAEHSMPSEWRWHNRRVVVADGTTLTMPDTPANQQEYPQHRVQAPGCGFPIMRLVVVFSLAVGTVLDVALAKYKGKLTGENSLLRRLRAALQPGDLLLLDRYFCRWFDLALWQQDGIDFVVRHMSFHARPTEAAATRRLGPNDRLVVWRKPKYCPAWMAPATYQLLPNALTLRELTIHVLQPGFRTKVLVVMTSLLDPVAFTADEIAQLYRQRWQAELNLRSLKCVMNMDRLRCTTPHRVRNEIYFHLLAYNLIRGVMAAAAQTAGRSPWTVSFKGTLQALNNLLPLVLVLDADSWCAQLLKMAAAFTVADRPDRYEPRRVKNTPKHYSRLKAPRHVYRTQMAAAI